MYSSDAMKPAISDNNRLLILLSVINTIVVNTKTILVEYLKDKK